MWRAVVTSIIARVQSTAFEVRCIYPTACNDFIRLPTKNPCPDWQRTFEYSPSRHYVIIYYVYYVNVTYQCHIVVCFHWKNVTGRSHLRVGFSLFIARRHTAVIGASMASCLLPWSPLWQTRHLAEAEFIRRLHSRIPVVSTACHLCNPEREHNARATLICIYLSSMYLITTSMARSYEIYLAAFWCRSSPLATYSSLVIFFQDYCIIVMSGQLPHTPVGWRSVKVCSHSGLIIPSFDELSIFSISCDMSLSVYVCVLLMDSSTALVLLFCSVTTACNSIIACWRQ